MPLFLLLFANLPVRGGGEEELVPSNGRLLGYSAIAVAALCTGRLCGDQAASLCRGHQLSCNVFSHVVMPGFDVCRTCEGLTTVSTGLVAATILALIFFQDFRQSASEWWVSLWPQLKPRGSRKQRIERRRELREEQLTISHGF